MTLNNPDLTQPRPDTTRNGSSQLGIYHPCSMEILSVGRLGKCGTPGLDLRPRLPSGYYIIAQGRYEGLARAAL